MSTDHSVICDHAQGTVRVQSVSDNAVSPCTRVHRWGAEYLDCEKCRALDDLSGLQLAYEWPVIDLLPQFEEREAGDDYDEQQSFSAAVAWAGWQRNMQGLRDADDIWRLREYGQPLMKINLAYSRTGEKSVQYWAATLLHELLHQMGSALISSTTHSML